jgi:hypothetical protein
VYIYGKAAVCKGGGEGQEAGGGPREVASGICGGGYGGSDDGVTLIRKALRMRNDNKDMYWELARTYLYSNRAGVSRHRGSESGTQDML